jgi:diaminopimelate epimerase
MIRLEKYQGLGNDFLVLLDLGDRRPVEPGEVRALCDRHRGVGADGLIRVTPGPPGADCAMELFNADGGRAEMSGNGIRCLAMAMVEAGQSDARMVVHTDAGARVVTVDEDGWASVDMGMARIDAKDGRVAFVDMGNPHTVIELDEGEDLDLLDVPTRAAVYGGRNVEFVVIGPGADRIRLRVWERGVGETQACGTGACAAAAAAFVWGRVGNHVTVTQPGGNATVDLRSDTIVLSGPAEHVATIEVPWLS